MPLEAGDGYWHDAPVVRIPGVESLRTAASVQGVGAGVGWTVGRADEQTSIMNLDESQREQVRQWINDGLLPAEIQNRLVETFGLRLTYMEVRFLLDDLKVQIKDPEPAAPAVMGSDGSTEAAVSPGAALDGDKGPDALAAGVSVTVDQVTRAGAVVSGRVTFSDGKTADWQLDQMGRLGLIPQEQGYRPSQEDLMSFQGELQSMLGRMGY
jgi:hypothetical protein